MCDLKPLPPPKEKQVGNQYQKGRALRTVAYGRSEDCADGTPQNKRDSGRLGL